MPWDVGKMGKMEGEKYIYIYRKGESGSSGGKLGRRFIVDIQTYTQPHGGCQGWKMTAIQCHRMSFTKLVGYHPKIL